VPKVVLNGTGVVAIIGELVAGCMPEHMGMHRE
jgi:hypothetical protein